MPRFVSIRREIFRNMLAQSQQRMGAVSMAEIRAAWLMATHRAVEHRRAWAKQYTL